MDHPYSFRDNGKQLYDLSQRILRLNHRNLHKDLHTFHEYKPGCLGILHHKYIQGDNLEPCQCNQLDKNKLGFLQ